MRILLSGACGSIFYPYYKHLESKGFEVLGMDIRSNPFSEDFLREKFLLGSDVSNEPDQYIDFLTKNIDRFDYFFPYADEELPILSSLSDDHILKKKVIVSNSESVNICVNKLSFLDFLQRNSIPCPSDSSVKKKIVKPALGRGGRNIFITDKENLVEPFRSSKDWIVSDYIDGIEYSVDLVGDGKGGVLGAISRVRVAAKGVSTEAEILMDEDAINLAKSAVLKLRLFGPINVQIIKEFGTNKLYIIEINPRLPGGAIFSSLGGLDLIGATIDFIEHGTVRSFSKPKGRFFCRYWCQKDYDSDGSCS